jgi:hypothetical protein
MARNVANPMAYPASINAIGWRSPKRLSFDFGLLILPFPLFLVSGANHLGTT